MFPTLSDESQIKSTTREERSLSLWLTIEVIDCFAGVDHSLQKKYISTVAIAVQIKAP